MKIRIFTILSAMLILIGCAKNETQDQNKESQVDIIIPESRIQLWNGDDFTGFFRFVEEEGVDVDSVWAIRDNVIHCGGVPNGYIRTDKNYANYVLHIEWRWVGEPGNSGVLLHMQLPDKVWPKSIEGQLMSGNAGDIYLIDGTEIAEQTDKSSRRIEKMSESNENPPGEWNSYDVTCKGDSIILIINGETQNIASRASVQSGKICFQSEGKPIQFRNIYLDPVE